MNGAQLARRMQDVVDRVGPWRDSNIRLTPDLYTIRPGLIGPREMHIRRMLQIVADNCRRPLSHLRVLDLAAHEGGLAVELARHGAQVVALVERAEHVAQAEFVKDTLKLGNLQVIHGGVGHLDQGRFGAFDVILCLGVLDRLDAQAVVPLVDTLARLADDMVIVETHVGLHGRQYVTAAGHRYVGTVGRVTSPAEVDGGVERTFWPTRASLLNLLADGGFTSVAECLNPPLVDVEPYVDLVTLLARKGQPVRMRNAPEVDRLQPDVWRRPERTRRLAHPAQGWWWSILDRVDRIRGQGYDRRAGARREVPPTGDGGMTDAARD